MYESSEWLENFHLTHYMLFQIILFVALYYWSSLDSEPYVQLLKLKIYLYGCYMTHL